MKTGKFITILETVIGIALALCLFLGALGLLGFVIALILGGNAAEQICAFLSETYYVILIKVATITTVFCFVLQYANGNAKWVNPFRKKG